LAAIYLHIPFCRKICYYCDFYKTRDKADKQDFLQALDTEMALRRNFFDNQPIDTVYLGGGTPSVLKQHEFEQIFNSLKRYFSLRETAEITIEVNPDDISSEAGLDWLKAVNRLGINRLSIGIQSFDEADLQRMNRRHTAAQAVQAVQLAQQAGFQNISIDLIYGLPEMTQVSWQNNLKQAFELNVQHISAYHLTYEANTVFENHLRKGKIKSISEAESIAQFRLLRKLCHENGFRQYEISNFAQAGRQSKHNSSYWRQEAYLGLGASAHSYNLRERSWNIANTEKYIAALKGGKLPQSSETLSLTDRYNDLIMTQLRTTKGLSLLAMQQQFGSKLTENCLLQAEKFIQQGVLQKQNNYLFLSEDGMLISDHIIAELFVV